MNIYLMSMFTCSQNPNLDANIFGANLADLKQDHKNSRVQDMGFMGRANPGWGISNPSQTLKKHNAISGPSPTQALSARLKPACGARPGFLITLLGKSSQ